MTATGLFERYQVIDVDTHLTEPAGVWVDRVSSKWGDRVPHIERVDGRDMWMTGGERIGAPGPTTMAGFNGTLPDSPTGYDDIPRAAFDARARLALMDELGIHAQVIFPNTGGFGSATFLKLGDTELVSECLCAYNDFLADWTSTDPSRLVPAMSTPFWDVDFAVREIERSVANGHKAVNFCNQPDSWGFPKLYDPHWDPIWAAAQDADVPVTFHIGGGDISGIMAPAPMGFRANFARFSSMLFVDNARCLGDLIFGGICHRFPRLRFVSVESGVGWIPGVLEAFDWQWRNGGLQGEHPEWDLLPSEYFRRQIYGCFWFEREMARVACEMYPDNCLYETDFPHPTCQYPSPVTPAQFPADYANAALTSLPEPTLRKVLHDNAARLFKI